MTAYANIAAAKADIAATIGDITADGGITPTLHAAMLDNVADTLYTCGFVADPLSQFAATTSAQLLATISDETGSGSLVFGTSPTLTTPVLGVASATTINKVALTQPATGSTLTIVEGATLTVSASATITDGTHSGTNTGDQTNITGNAATVTTNANLTGPITSTGNATAITAQTGTGTTFVMQASPTLTTPNLGTPSAGVLSSCSAYEGTSVASTGEAGAVKFLREDGDNTSSWQALPTTFYESLWIGAGAMTSRTTNGAEFVSEEYPTNDIRLDLLLFDSVTEEGAQFAVVMPDQWDGGTVKVKVYWDAATGATAADTVSWKVNGGTLSNDDPIDTALGTQVTINDIVIAVGDVHVSPTSSALTITGTPALGDLIIFQVVRNVAGTDDMTEDAKLIGISIQYLKTTDAAAW